MEAREGQQSGDDTTAFVNRVPCSSNQNRVLGIAAIVPLNWSSVTMKRMLGGESTGDDSPRGSPALLSGSSPFSAFVHAATVNRARQANNQSPRATDGRPKNAPSLTGGDPTAQPSRKGFKVVPLSDLKNH